MVIAGYVTVLILGGGISIPTPWMVMFQSGLSLLVIGWALIRLAKQGFPTKLAFWGAVIAAGAIGLVLAQLLPLPPTIWQTFPSRDLVIRNYALIGELPGWSPLSLSPDGTSADGIALLPGLAAFLAVLTVNARQVFWIGAGIVTCAIISIGFSLLQHFDGGDSAYYLYDSAGGIGVGTFNNRNFFAAQLYTSIPILSAFAVAAQDRWRLRPILVLAAGIVYAGIILVGLSLSASRTGILLAMPAVLFGVILAYSRSSGPKHLSATTYGLIALLFGFFVVGQASVVGLLRLVQSDPLTDYRAVISKGSIELALRFVPTGGGFGTFVPLYQLQETPETMRPEYVNHAHNDWLELVIEGGGAAVILLAAFLLWFILSALRVWRYGQGGRTALFQRMASLVLPLLLLHSFVDFPLRTPALLILFALCCGIITLKPEILKSATPPGRSRKPPAAPVITNNPGERKPFRRPQTGFGASAPVNPGGASEDPLQ
jgi:O-Antigen ligase